MNEGRTDQPDADTIDQARSVAARQFFGVNDLLFEGCPASPVLSRPAYSYPSRGIHFPMPLEVKIPIGGIIEHELRTTLGLRARWYVSFEPFTEFAPKGFSFFAVIEIHRPLSR